MVRPLEAHLEEARRLIGFAAEIASPRVPGREIIVEFPFVDSSSLLRSPNPAGVGKALKSLAGEAKAAGVRIAVETDLPPAGFKEFLDGIPRELGANLDLGNSAALGYDVREEVSAYGGLIMNVNIKDRVRRGTTVALTAGAVDFKSAFEALGKADHSGDFILQTAPDPDYLGAASRYRGMVSAWQALL